MGAEGDGDEDREVEGVAGSSSVTTRIVKRGGMEMEGGVKGAGDEEGQDGWGAVECCGSGGCGVNGVG